MAEPIVREFVVDTSKTEQNLESVNKSTKSWAGQLRDLKNQLKTLDPNSDKWNEVATAYKEAGGSMKFLSEQATAAGKNLNDLSNPADNATQSLDGLKKQLSTLNKEFDKIAASDAGSARYKELAKQIADVKQQISDASTAVNNEATPAFQGFTGNISDAKEKLLALDFKGATESFKSLGDNVKNFKAQDLVAGLNNIKAGFISLGKALIANPLFAVAGAIAAAIAYREQLLSLIDGVTDADQERLAAQKESATLAKQQLDAIGEQENILRLQGKTEKEILQLKVIAGKEAILQQKAVIETLKLQKQQQIDAAERNKAILKGLLNFISLPLTAILTSVDLLTTGLNKAGFLSDETFGKIGNLRDKFTTSVAELVFNPAEVAKEGDAAIAEAEKALKGLENQQAGFQLSINQINQKGADDRQKTRDEEIEAERKAAQEIYNIRKKNAEELAKITEQIRKDAAKPVESTKTQLTDADAELKAQQDAQDLAISLMADGQDKEIALVDAKYAKLREQAQGNAELQKQIAEQNQAEVDAIIQKGVDKEVAIRQAGFKKGLDLASSAIQVLQAFSDASTKKGEADARKKFRTDKALAIGAATVQTASAVTGALTAGGNPIKLATGQQFVEAGIAAALGIAQIVKIKNSQFGGGGDTGGSTPSVPSAGGTEGTQPAQFNPFANINVEGRPNQPTPRAYVLAGDVASQQEVRQKVEDLSRIG